MGFFPVELHSIRGLLSILSIVLFIVFGFIVKSDIYINKKKSKEYDPFKVIFTLTSIFSLILYLFDFRKESPYKMRGQAWGVLLAVFLLGGAAVLLHLIFEANYLYF